MYSLAKTEALIQGMEQSIASAEAVLRTNAQDRFATLSKRLSEEKRKEYQAERQFLLNERKVELIELHLEGPTAKRGEVPFNIWTILIGNYCDVLLSAGTVAQYGAGSKKRPSKDIHTKMNLRVGRQMPGSTRVTIIGELTSDLFGGSLLLSALRTTFSLFNASTEQVLLDATSRLLPSGIKAIQKMLNCVSKSNLNLDIDWDAPDGTHYGFAADKARLAALSQSLSSIIVHEPRQENVEGLLFEASLDGHIVITLPSGKGQRYKYPAMLTEKMKTYSLGNPIQGRALVIESVNTVTQAKSERWEIIELA